MLEDLKSGNNVRILEVTHKASSNVFMRIINHVHTQLKILRYLVAVSGKVHFFVFFIGGGSLLIPMLFLKFLRKKVALMPGGIATKGHFIRMDPLSKFLSMLVDINFRLADRLIIYSATLAREANLAKYQHKIITAHEHFIDFTEFALKKKIDERLEVVGYMGRLSREKGILNLVRAVPFVLNERAETCFVICGGGSLVDEVRRIVRAKGIETHVELMRWVAHEDLPGYLNELKLLVLPSFTEGLPNIMLEAMACGAPVLATTVGAIPDIIKDRQTGFLLESNDPKHIAERIVELLNDPKQLEIVSENAYRWVRENFSEERAVQTWQKVLGQLKTA